METHTPIYQGYAVGAHVVLPPSPTISRASFKILYRRMTWDTPSLLLENLVYSKMFDISLTVLEIVIYNPDNTRNIDNILGLLMATYGHRYNVLQYFAIRAYLQHELFE
jgi:hypothetical protein